MKPTEFLNKLVALVAIVTVGSLYNAVFLNLDAMKNLDALSPTAKDIYRELKDILLVGSSPIVISAVGILSNEYSIPYMNIIFSLYAVVLFSTTLSLEAKMKNLTPKEKDSLKWTRNTATILALLSGGLAYSHAKHLKNAASTSEEEGVEV